MALPPTFTDELRARLPVASVIGRRVRLTRSGKQWKGCCPFHGEKTPSFYVYDDHYHCFGCGAHGDAITFVMQSQGLGFTDAITMLAAEAGMEVPKATPEAAEAERRRLTTMEVLVAAEAHYIRRLQSPEGKAARQYLLDRGLSNETIARFGLGWAGERGQLTAQLQRDGIEPRQMEAAGLLRRDEDSGRSYELFHNRVMFPIRDRRGDIISFGGRILGSGQPKYVNGPETAVFSKRRNLFGLKTARDGVRNGAALVVVEGYMDVIALAQAGFAGAVAPLGTALTQEQLDELWRASPCPVLCFDGDAAGSRAAGKAIDLALPMLTPRRSLRFATLPAGDDPDSLVRKAGPGAFQAVLDAAKPPADALFAMLRQETGSATPEQRAALRSRLVEAAGRVADRSLAAEYRNVLLTRFFEEVRAPSRAGSRPGAKRNGSTAAMAPRPLPHGGNAAMERMRILTAILLRHPYLLHDLFHAYGTLGLPDKLAKLRDGMLSWSENTAERGETLDSADLMDHLTKSGFELDVQSTLASVPMPLPACAGPDVMPAEAEAGWWHIFGFLNVDHLREEVALAEADLARNLTPETQRRHQALVEALWKVRSGEPDGAGSIDV